MGRGDDSPLWRGLPTLRQKCTQFNHSLRIPRFQSWEKSTKVEDNQPCNYIIKTIDDSETVGYLQLMQTDRTAPSVILYIRPDARRKGYGYDALMAMIEALKEESVYAALYFIVNAADAAKTHLAEKCPFPKKALECPELGQIVKVYRIEL